jgi:RNA polymerase primary sigma factor
VSIAKKHMGRSNSIFEVISDGNLSLMRAVEKFNVALGNKFSTYASWSIMKNFARTIPENHYHMRRYLTGQDEMLDATAGQESSEPCRGDVEAVREALSGVMGELTERERSVVVNHFGLFGANGSTCTLEDLGVRFGVTKERIRQIEKRAIEKLRGLLSPNLLDAFGD